jgi:hypothetical protein
MEGLDLSPEVLLCDRKLDLRFWLYTNRLLFTDTLRAIISGIVDAGGQIFNEYNQRLS